MRFGRISLSVFLTVSVWSLFISKLSDTYIIYSVVPCFQTRIRFNKIEFELVLKALRSGLFVLTAKCYYSTLYLNLE